MKSNKPDVCKGCPLELGYPLVPVSCTCQPCNDEKAHALAELTGSPTHPCKANMLIISVAPNYHDVREGKPLVGPLGRKVDAALQWAISTILPTSTLTVRKTYVVKCRVTQPGKSGTIDRAPTRTEIAHCTKRHLADEISRPNLKVIVPLGEAVFKVLCSAKFKESVGSRVDYSAERMKHHMEGIWAKIKGL